MIIRKAVALCALVGALSVPKVSEGFLDSFGGVHSVSHPDNPTLTKKPTLYNVQPGDTLGSIAERFCHRYSAVPNVTKYNNIEHPDKIKPGQVLVVDNPGVCDGLYLKQNQLLSTLRVYM